MFFWIFLQENPPFLTHVNIIHGFLLLHKHKIQVLMTNPWECGTVKKEKVPKKGKKGTDKDMEKRILQYRHFMDELVKDITQNHNKSRDELEEIRKEHLTQISFFQHERLIHLIVTVTFALLEILSLLMTMINAELFSLLLSLVVLILLIPYIRHYYILENEVQKMYGQYDAICKELYEGKTFTVQTENGSEH